LESPAEASFRPIRLHRPFLVVLVPLFFLPKTQLYNSFTWCNALDECGVSLPSQSFLAKRSIRENVHVLSDKEVWNLPRVAVRMERDFSKVWDALLPLLYKD